jgi:tRNA(Ile)-lysidine synthase
MAARGPRSLPGADRGLVVAVSGGADSVALLRALVEVRPAGAALVVAHLHHCLRGAESDADEAFVTELHRSLMADVPNLELCVTRLDVAAESRRAGANLEATARRLRYRWLAEVARQCGLAWIATGHTASDQAETVLHRLLRGTGLSGLRGIAARRTLEPGMGVVRPLLRATRADIIAALRSLGQTWREDSSNRDTRYTRNRIRHELLPHLAEHYNPAIERVLGRLAEQAAKAFGEEERQAKELLREAELPRAGALVILDRGRLATAPRRLVRAVFRLIWEREGWPRGAMDFDHWDRLGGVAAGEVSGADLPGKIHAQLRERIVQIGPDAD